MATLSNTFDIPLALAPSLPPACFVCNNPSRRLVTRSSNRNGNAGRPYHKCTNCRRFLGFADVRGNSPDNPPCYCRESSKAQVTGQNSGSPGRLHYVCRQGTCDYYAEGVGQNNKQISFSRDIVDRLARLGLI
ncbi:uncharacterized protein FMAN_08183 [Fusarium mangiferae]|uniref:GRF-like zinc ribbon domain-containing protein n=1 Tax=Fusarium mangiferae TaxID=192010 RepID=A0A1L7U1A3_FUSMA|nr:uncharacterized protein FMAN_08183 [Fusarium mangiferae]CVL02063.1 uncharacterized protein FMAN_08183 [Fusarium mangiferae]